MHYLALAVGFGCGFLCAKTIEIVHHLRMQRELKRMSERDRSKIIQATAESILNKTKGDKHGDNK